MKKIYLTPQTETVKISVEQLLQASLDLQGKNASTTNGEYDESRGSSWFDED